MKKGWGGIVIDVEVTDGFWIITLPKSILVLTRGEFIQALRRGKWHRRRESLKARARPLAHVQRDWYNP
jgi:hypothetical protein